jgi:hypothetical protein
LNAPDLLACRTGPACCEDEQWKQLPCWPHEVSSCGRVRSIDRLDASGVWRLGAMLPQHPDKRRARGTCTSLSETANGAARPLSPSSCLKRTAV